MMSSARTAWIWQQQAKAKMSAAVPARPRSLGESDWQHQAHAIHPQAALSSPNFVVMTRP
jgi:hypothetical protein